MKKFVFIFLILHSLANAQPTSDHLTPFRVQNWDSLANYGRPTSMFPNGTGDLVVTNFPTVKIWTLCSTCTPIVVPGKVVIQGFSYRKWWQLNPDEVDTIYLSGSSLFFSIGQRLHSVTLPTGGGGGGGLVGSYSVKQYLNGYLNFVNLNTDSIQQGSTNLFNQSHTGDATGATALTVVGIRNNLVPSLSIGNLRWNGSAWIFDNTTYLTAITGNNGVSVSGSNVQLGGNPLIQNTAINAAHFEFKVDSAKRQSFTVANDSLVTKFYAARDTLLLSVSKNGTYTSTTAGVSTATIKAGNNYVQAGVNSTTVSIQDGVISFKDPLGGMFIDTLVKGNMTDSFVVWANKQLKAVLLTIFDASHNGLVPNSSSAIAGSFLRYDGIWAVPSGTGGGMTSWDVANSAGTSQYSISDGTKLRFQGAAGVSITFPGTNTIQFSIPTDLASFTNGPGFITTSIFHIANSAGISQFDIATNNTLKVAAGPPLSVAFDAANRMFTFSHAVSGVTAGTYNNITVDAYGHATTGSNVAYLTSLAHVHGIANYLGSEQFTFGVGDDIRIEGTGTASVAFDAATKKITINAASSADGNTFVTSLGFNTGTGNFTATRNDAVVLTQNLDGRYLTSFTETDPLSVHNQTSQQASANFNVSGTGKINGGLYASTLNTYSGGNGLVRLNGFLSVREVGNSMDAVSITQEDVGVVSFWGGDGSGLIYGDLEPNVMSGPHTWYLPDNGGTLPVDVNSVFANSAGHISLTTSNIPEGSNQYFTLGRARNSLSLNFTTTGTSGAATGTYNNLTGVFTFNIPNYAYILPTASPSVLGGVKVDGTTITISGGVISANASGITSLNSQTGASQTFVTGTSGTDFNISSASNVHTFNIPSATPSARGLVTTGAQTFAGDKTFNGNVTISGGTTLLNALSNNLNSYLDAGSFQIYQGQSFAAGMNLYGYSHANGSRVDLLTSSAIRLSINSSGNVTINDLSGTGTRIVTATSAGLLQTMAAYTANNAVTMTATNLQWGGTLVHNTTVDQAGYQTLFQNGDWLALIGNNAYSVQVNSASSAQHGGFVATYAGGHADTYWNNTGGGTSRFYATDGFAIQESYGAGWSGTAGATRGSVLTTPTSSSLYYEQIGSTPNAVIVNSTGIYVSGLNTGTVYSNGGYLTNVNPSDKRLKNSVKQFKYGLDEILKLAPKSFYYNTDTLKTNLQYGFLADDVEKIMPDAVRRLNNKTDMKGIETNAIYVALVVGMQQQQAEINKLNKRVDSLTKLLKK